MIWETMHEFDEMIFCYESILFEMLWWSLIEHIDFMMYYIDWFRYYMIICFIIEIRIWNMIDEELWYKKYYELITWLCKGPCQWGHIRWQLFVLRVCRQRDQRHVARETSDKPPERPAVPKDMATRWFAAYRKQIRDIIMTLPQKKCGHSSWLTKRIEEQKKLK